MLSLVGLVKPASGRIEFLGHDFLALPTERIVTLGIGLVPEGRWVLGDMTVYDNLLLGAYIRKGASAALHENLEQIYALCPVLRERARQLAATLSGGEQQMLVIARALMARPKLLLMDEPSVRVVPLIVEEIFRVIKELHARGTTILLVEQNAYQALHLTHCAYVMEVGRIVLSGAAAELREREVLKKAYWGVRAAEA